MMWVLKIQTSEGIYRIPSGVEQPTFSHLKAAFKKHGQDIKNARYIDEDGDQCTLCEATFQDFLGFAVESPSKQKVLKLVILAQSESSSDNAKTSKDCKEEKKRRRGKPDRHGKKKGGRGRSRSSSSGSSSGSSSSGSSDGGRRRGRKQRKHRRSRSRSRSSSHGSRRSRSSSHRSSSSGSSRSRSSSSGCSFNGQFHHCSSCRFEDGKITYWLEESFKRYSCLTLIPGGSKTVQRAFYGDCNNAFKDGHGKDVTEAVKAVLDCGQPLQAMNDVFGDPLPGTEKMLLVEAAIPPCPVSAEKAEGFIKALRDEYVNDVHCGVGNYFEQEKDKFEPHELHILESFERVVRTALPSHEAAISMFASSWGVKEAPKEADFEEAPHFEGAILMEDLQ